MENLRKLVPKDRADLFGVGTTLVLLSFVTVNDILVINSNREGGDDLKCLLVLAIGLYILFNALGNMYKAISVNTSIDSIEVQIKQLPEWRFCSNCEQYAPPRSYHCFTCNKCILKRHNHCLFLGNC
jgi:palmitoyltransferase